MIKWQVKYTAEKCKSTHMGENNCKIYLAKSEPIIKFYQSGKASDSFRIVLRIQNSAAAPKAKMLRISRKELRTT